MGFSKEVQKKPPEMFYKKNLFKNFERDVDVQIVLSRELCVISLDFFYPNGAMRHIAKSNLLKEIEIKRYSLPS